MCVRGARTGTQPCRMEETAALQRCLPAACPRRVPLWPLLAPQHVPATRSLCQPLATLLKLHCQPLKMALKLIGLVQLRECLLLLRLLTALVPALLTGPASPEGAPAEALSMGNSSESGAVLHTAGRLPPRPTTPLHLHMPEGGRRPGLSAKSPPSSSAGIQVKAKPVAEPTQPEVHQGSQKRETRKRVRRPSRDRCGSRGA